MDNQFSKSGLIEPSPQDTLLSVMHERDKQIRSLFEKIDEATSVLEDDNRKDKYEQIISIEYLLVRIRIKLTDEFQIVKQALNDTTTSAALRGIFIKRADYISQLNIRLDSLREDISVLQKTVYTQQTKNIYK